MYHCACVGHVAWLQAHQRAAEETLPLEAYRKIFNERYVRTVASKEVNPELADELFVRWLELTQPYWDAVHEAFVRNPLNTAPDPNCPYCGGTGQVEEEPTPQANDLN